MFQSAYAVSRILPGLALIGASYALAAEPPTIQAQQVGTRLLVSGAISVPVSPAVAWAVLTDYERIPEFVPGMRVSRVIETSGNTKVVEQQGEMQANNMRMLYLGNLRIVEEPSSRLSLQFVSGNFRGMQGQWAIEGKASPVNLAYQLDFDAGTPYPSPVMSGLMQQQVLHWVASLSAEMERRAQLEPQPKPKPQSKPRSNRKKNAS